MGARYDDFGKVAEAAYQQRVLATNGLGPTKQELTNQRLAEQRYDQGRLRTQDIKNDAAEFALNEAKYPRYQPTASMVSTGGTRTKAPTASTQIPEQSGYQYNIDYQAAQDAGNFLRALKGQTGDATNRKTGAPDTTAALELLNKTPYSSINNATGISLDTDEQGNQMVSIMGPENTLLKQIPMATLERQLSNLNNYANRERLHTTPAREAILGSKELAEGAAAARVAATDPQNLESMGYTEDESGRYSRRGKNGGLEFYDANTAGQQAYDGFMRQYGPREAAQEWRPDAGFARTQTPAGGYSLGFDVASRQPKKPTLGSTFDPLQLARQQAGVGGSNAGDQGELPPPDPASARQYQPAPTNKPTGGSRYMPSPFGYQPSGSMNTQQAKYQPAPIGIMPQQQGSQFNPQEQRLLGTIRQYQQQGQQVTPDVIQQLIQQMGLPAESYQKIAQYMQG